MQCDLNGLISYDNVSESNMVAAPDGVLPNGDTQSVGDMGGCTYEDVLNIANRPLQPGIYNLVVQVESEAHVGGTFNSKIKIPIDLLLYLYSPMHYCSLDCKNVTQGGNPTFANPEGFYGNANGDQCKICGGGYLNTSLYWPSCDLSGFSQRLGVQRGILSHPLVYNFTQCEPEDDAPICSDVDNYGTEQGVSFPLVQWGGFPFPFPKVNDTIFSTIRCSRNETFYEYESKYEFISGRKWIPSITMLGCENSCPRYEDGSNCLAGQFPDGVTEDTEGLSVIPIQASCIINVPPIIVDEFQLNIDGSQADNQTTPTLTESSGYTVGQVTGTFCDLVEYSVVAKDIDHCTELSLITIGLLSGQTFLTQAEMGSAFFDFPNDERQIRRTFQSRPWNTFGSMFQVFDFDETTRPDCVLDTRAFRLDNAPVSIA